MIGQTKRPKWWHTHYKTPNNRQRAGVLLFYLALPRPTSLYLALPRSTSLYLAPPRPISLTSRAAGTYQQSGLDLPAGPGLTSRAGTYETGGDLASAGVQARRVVAIPSPHSLHSRVVGFQLQ